MNTYKLIVGCNLNQYETNTFDPDTYLALDVINDRTITSNSHIASQPMQTGDTVSDHMYREPVKYTVNGIFGIDSKHWENDFYTEYDKADRLTNIETVFEKIKNEGILCTLTFIQTDDDNDFNPPTDGTSTRFITRKNMALNGITWVEQLNTVRFTFNFTEIIMVSNQEIYNPDSNTVSNLYLPNLTAPKGATLSQVISDNDELKTMIVKELDAAGYISDQFKKEVQDKLNQIGAQASAIPVALVAVGTVLLAAGIVGVASTSAAVVGVASFVAGALGTSAIFPVGTIIVGGAVILGGIVFGIAKAIENNKQKLKYSQGFNTLKDVDKLADILKTAKNSIKDLDAGITLYEFPFDEEVEVLIKLGSEIYSVVTGRNNTSDNEWMFTVNAVNTKLIQYNPNPAIITDLSTINSNTSAWFTDSTGENIAYLYNPSLTSSVNKTDEEMNNVRKNLKSYFIIVSNGRIEDNLEYFYKKLQTTLIAQGFTDVKKG